MIGLILILIELILGAAYIVLKITGLWVSLIVLIILMLINSHVTPVNETLAYYIFIASLIPSGILFIRNMIRMVMNIISIVRNIVD